MAEAGQQATIAHSSHYLQWLCLEQQPQFSSQAVLHQPETPGRPALSRHYLLPPCTPPQNHPPLRLGNLCNTPLCFPRIWDSSGWVRTYFLGGHGAGRCVLGHCAFL